MPKTLPIFYSALLLTGVNLLLRLVGTTFQVYLSATLGAAGIGLLQLTMSVGSLAMVAGMAGIRTASMYLTAEELGRKKPENIAWVLSGCFLYSIAFSGSIAALLYSFAPQIARYWIGDMRTLEALRLFAAFLPVTCLCGVMTAIGEPWPAVDEADVLEACLPAQGAITVAQVQSRATGQVGEEPLAVWTLHELPVPCLLQGMAGCITRGQQRTSGVWLVGAQQIR